MKRSSLDVPGPDSTVVADTINGSPQGKGNDSDGSEKRDSGSRVGTKFVGGKRVPSTPPQEGTPPRGVTLEDKPMDD